MHNDKGKHGPGLFLAILRMNCSASERGRGRGGGGIKS